MSIDDCSETAGYVLFYKYFLLKFLFSKGGGWNAPVQPESCEQTLLIVVPSGLWTCL